MLRIVVGGFVAMGVVYWIAVWIAVVLVAGVAGVIVLALVALYAVLAYLAMLGRAVREHDGARVFDLMFFPVTGLLGAWAAWSNPQIGDQVQGVFDQFNADQVPGWAWGALFAAGVAFLWGVFGTWVALRADRPGRFLAYPGSFFYGAYVTFAVLRSPPIGL